MKKRIAIAFLIISIVGFIFSLQGLLYEWKAKELSVAFIEETYGGDCLNNIRANIYGEEDGYYAVYVRSNDKTFYLKIKLSMWGQTEEILDASEYNQVYSCEEELDV
ncbi:hypothetical protein HMPREF1210_02202 [Paenisporosarcina sp. HGH0030]|uniref:hypothetical protein n=1 Tax=Paenisporosarcina sp. HGH0030 TaxID=1078085 RepID=UPI00034E685C|nr:hypothetical protein [Paenisporosarcina sp. HGH0030]EPD51011.1 hypothetical protein HMPREF1210_02202 [Paenisporosarcina sp. HGH0030]